MHQRAFVQFAYYLPDVRVERGTRPDKGTWTIDRPWPEATHHHARNPTRPITGALSRLAWGHGVCACWGNGGVQDTFNFFTVAVAGNRPYSVQVGQNFGRLDAL